jgi:hypothetical protein
MAGGHNAGQVPWLILALWLIWCTIVHKNHRKTRIHRIAEAT